MIKLMRHSSSDENAALGSCRFLQTFTGSNSSWGCVAICSAVIQLRYNTGLKQGKAKQKHQDGIDT